ncbi:MAG: invasion associated locus B family protein [Aestuariivirga sp.]
MVANMILLRRAGAAALLLGSVFGAGGAQAVEPSPLGTFKDWTAYTYKAADTKVCYVVSQPKSSAPKAAKRDPIFFLVTHMPGRKVKGEVSTIIGYPFKKEAVVTIKVDDKSFQLFTSADGAWADKPDTEKQIVAAMKDGKSLSVEGVSWRGTETTDTYSLAGLTAAMDKIDEACK